MALGKRIYSLPSPISFTKKCKSYNIELSHTGILKEDTNCQFYSEAFILFPVSDGDTNVSLASSQVLPSHTNCQAAPRVPATNSVMTDCPSCVAGPLRIWKSRCQSPLHHCGCRSKWFPRMLRSERKIPAPEVIEEKKATTTCWSQNRDEKKRLN
jgi:hypothetical protein